MIKIAVCDDDFDEIQTITNLLHTYRETKAVPMQISTFQNGFSFLDSIDRGAQYDITFLDILMPEKNGMDIARELRRTHSDMEIIFLTSSPEYAVDSYEVYAQDYILKPISENRFFSSLDRLMKHLQKKENSSFIIYNSSKQYTKILFSQLVYAEAMHKSVYLYLTDHTVITTGMTFKNFLQLLKTQPDFIYPHRSYVVNMNFIQYVGKNELCLIDGRKIPLSRNHYESVSKQFLDFVCSVSFE